MSQSNYGTSKGYVATAAIPGEGYIVKLVSNQAVVATAGTDVSIGITENPAAIGETASVRLRSSSGTAKVKLGGAVAVNDPITATTGGKGVVTSTAGHHVVGYALEAGVLNDLVEVSLTNSKF